MTELEYSEFLKSETDLEREAELLALEHYGVKGMRWGVIRTPEQLGHQPKKKSLVKKIQTAAKKRATKKKREAAKKAKVEQAKKAKEAAKSAESNEKIREKVLQSNDPSLIYKYRDLLSTSELQDRIDRISKEEKIKSLIKDPKADQKAAMKKGEDTLKSLASMAESVGKMYDTYNKITGGKKKREDDGQKDKQKDKKSDSKDDQNESKDKKQEKEKTSTWQEAREAKAKEKATKEFLSDPGVQALMALGNLSPSDRKKVNERAQREFEKRKKQGWGNSSSKEQNWNW